MKRFIQTILYALIFSGCSGNLNIHLKEASDVSVADKTRPSVTINQAITEVVGGCSFVTPIEPTNRFGFSYRITFSKPIDASSFTEADISNSGTGGGYLLDWDLQNCGDNQNFKLTAIDIEGNGTIIPSVLSGIIDSSSNINTVSTSTDNSVSFFREWTQEAYIKAPNAGTDDQFGEVVALNGETLVVATSNEDSNQITITNGTGASADDSNLDSGAVYVYRRTGTTWTQEAYIKAVNNDANDGFGVGIAINRDTLVIGADGERSSQTTITNGPTASANDSLSAAGAVYVYKRSGGVWSQEAYIKASNANTSDFFGRDVSVHEDTLVVGAMGEDSSSTTIINGAGTDPDNSLSSSGAAYVYRRTGTNWAQEAILRGSITSSFFNFGTSVAVEGNTIAVAAVGGGVYAEGSVYVFKRTGVTWVQEALLNPVNPFNFIRFGQILSLSKETLSISATAEVSNQTTITNGPTASDDQSFNNSGAVYVYKRSGASWVQEAYIKSSNNSEDDFFGSGLSLEGDMLIVSSPFEDSNQMTITNGPTSSTDDSKLNSGAVYVYLRKGNIWYQNAYIKSVNSDVSDAFGGSVSISGDSIAVGVPNEDSNQITITNGSVASSDNSLSASGAVYIYRYNGRLFDVSDVWGTADSSSVTLNWHRTGGLATGYLVAYQMGSTAPATCSLGTVINVLNANTHHEMALSSAQAYSFRVCATDGTDITAGTAFTITTL